MALNIGIVTTWLDRGAAYVSRAYKETLERGGHNVFIYARGGEYYAKGDDKWDLPNVTWSPKLNKTKLPLHHYYKWLKRNHIDLVIFNEQRDFKAVDFTKKMGITTAAYVDYYTKETYRDFAKYDLLFCNTKRHYSVFKNFEGAHYFPWGVDLSLFQYNPNHDDKVIFFHNAGMNTSKNKDRKGTDLLIEAYSKIPSGISELVVHSQLSISNYPDLQELMKVRSDVTFIERTIPPPGLYHLGNVYVYPTRLEGIGLTITEALSVGLPVIVPNEAPMNEFITHEENGLLVNVKARIKRQYYWEYIEAEVDDLTYQMKRIITDQKLRDKLQKNARKSAENLWDWKNNFEPLNNIVSNLDEKNNLNRDNLWMRIYSINSQISDKSLYLFDNFKNKVRTFKNKILLEA